MKKMFLKKILKLLKLESTRKLTKKFKILLLTKMVVKYFFGDKKSPNCLVPCRTLVKGSQDS